MQTKFNSLPDWDFVGGETQCRTFELYESDGMRVCDIPGAVCEMAVVDFINQDSQNRLLKSATITNDENGNTCFVTVSLSPSDTVSMSGKYLYQLTIKDAKGNITAPRGIMRVYKNIDRDFLTR